MKALLTLILLCSSQAWAWGERGHNITGHAAALITDSLLSSAEQEKLGPYFRTRNFVLGHLNNIPDISWKDKRRKEISELNFSTHFFDAELIFGEPGEDFSQFQNTIRNVDTDIDHFLEQYNNKPNSVFKDVGVAPFRVGQLYAKMVDALTCAKKKKDSGAKKSEEFKEPIQNGNYVCSDKTTRIEDLSAAIEIGGVMGHFVADLSQPLHTTANFDGFYTGQGGIHHYFETQVIYNVDPTLLNDVIVLAENSDFQKSTWERLQASLKDTLEPTKLMFHLVADSQGEIKKLLELDRQNSLISEGVKLAVGQKQDGHHKEAVRRPPQSKSVVTAFRPLVVSRLATGALLLSRLWVQAWRAAGSPNASDANLYAFPYPLDVPFILPDKRFLPPEPKAPAKKKKSRR